MFTNEIIIKILERMKDVTIEERRPFSIVVGHNSEDWDLLTSLAQNLSMPSDRWMQNGQPRTTIHHG